MSFSPSTARLGAAVVLVYGMIGLASDPMLAAPAGQNAAMQLDIGSGNLASVLRQFATATHTRIEYDSASVQNITSPGIRGQYSIPAALSQLLAGHGLIFQESRPGNYIIRPVQKAANSIVLGPVRVGGQNAHQNPTGPGVGYVASSTMSGTKTDTPIMEIPNSIYVITKQQMIDQQPQNVMEALRYSPGINAETMGSYQSGAPNTNNIMQRGFASSQFVDGIRSNSSSAAETAFLDRIEAFNGPASVMYGQTTPGGMINMSLKKPTMTPLHNVTLGFGNWGRYEATFDVSDKVTKSGNVRYRIAGIGVTQGTQTNYIDYRRVGVLPSITWDIDHKTSLTLLGSYLYTPQDGTNNTQLPPQKLLATGDYGRIPRSRFLGSRNWNETGRREATFEYQFRHTFNRFIDFTQNFRWEQANNNVRDMNTGLGMISPELLRRNGLSNYGRNTTVGLDTRLGGKFNIGAVRNTWVVGSDFRQYNYSGGGHTDYTGGYNGYPGSDGYSVINIYHPVDDYVPCMNIRTGNCIGSGSTGHNEYFQEGIYFQDQIKYRGLSVTLGGRQDWVNYHGRSSYWNNRTNQNEIVVNNSTQVPRPQSAFTWRAGLVYEFNFGLAPYFSYSTSFVPQSGQDWKGTPFPPLTGHQLEAGMKYQTPDKNVLLTAAAYQIDENHYLVDDTLHPNYSADAGRVRSRGFEVSARANLTDDLRLIASYSYDEATYLSTNVSDEQDFADGTTGLTVSEKGKYIEEVPRNLVSAFLDYTPPSRFFKGFGINGGVRYVGSTFADAVNSFKVQSYTLFDIGAHYDFGQATPMLKGLRAQLAISNLTNKYYITSCGGTYSCYIGQGRRVYGNLSYSW